MVIQIRKHYNIEKRTANIFEHVVRFTQDDWGEWNKRPEKWKGDRRLQNF